VEQYHRSDGSSQEISPERDWEDTHPPDCFGRSAVLTKMIIEMAPPEQARLLAELRRARRGHWLAVHIVLLLALQRSPNEIAAFLLCQEWACSPRIVMKTAVEAHPL
jgi:hypothetical protein